MKHNNLYWIIKLFIVKAAQSNIFFYFEILYFRINLSGDDLNLNCLNKLKDWKS